MSFDVSLPRPIGIDWNGADRSHGQVRFADASQTVVLFYTKSVFNAAKSAEVGARQYENQVWVKIHPPGEKLNIIDREVLPADKQMYSQQWNAFLQHRTQVPEGTPIDLLFPNNPAIADNLKAFGVHTIQQCSKLSANALDTIGMGAQNWKNMATQYLENATSGTAFLQLRDENERLQQQIQIKDRQFAELKARMDDMDRRFKNPNTGGMQPGWIDGYDAQAERLNSNHPSQEMRPSVPRTDGVAPPDAELQQFEVIRQVTEESMPTVDVTGEDFAPAPAPRKKGK